MYFPQLNIAFYAKSTTVKKYGRVSRRQLDCLDRIGALEIKISWVQVILIFLLIPQSLGSGIAYLVKFLVWVLWDLNFHSRSCTVEGWHIQPNISMIAINKHCQLSQTMNANSVFNQSWTFKDLSETIKEFHSPAHAIFIKTLQKLRWNSPEKVWFPLTQLIITREVFGVLIGAQLDGLVLPCENPI